MKALIDLENLEDVVEQTLENNIKTVIKEQVDSSVRKYIDDLARKVIAEKVSDNFQRFVDEYISTTKIKVGGNYWSDEEQYIKKELKDRLESKSLRAKKKGRSSSYSDDYEQVTFEDYIQRQFDFDEMIKKHIDKFMDDIRKQVNKTMKETFNQSTKNMLSNAVLNILGANETYKQIENNIKCIADARN